MLFGSIGYAYIKFFYKALVYMSSNILYLLITS